MWLWWSGKFLYAHLTNSGPFYETAISTGGFVHVESSAIFWTMAIPVIMMDHIHVGTSYGTDWSIGKSFQPSLSACTRFGVGETKPKRDQGLRPSWTYGELRWTYRDIESFSETEKGTLWCPSQFNCRTRKGRRKMAAKEWGGVRDSEKPCTGRGHRPLTDP